MQAAPLSPFARRRFHALAGEAGGGHVGAFAEEGNAKARAQIAAKGHVGKGIAAADAVFKVRRAHVRARVEQQEQQRHGIRAAGEGHKHAPARRACVYAQCAAIHAAISSMSASLTRASADR